VGNTSLLGRITQVSSGWRYLIVLGIVALSAPVGSLSILLSPPGSSVAAWWPAASLTVLAALADRGRRVFSVAAIIALGVVSNYVAGRPLDVSIGFGISNALEAWTVAMIVTRGKDGFQMNRVPDAVRFVLAVLFGGVLIGLAAAAVVALLAGGSFLPTFASVAPSHASAVLVIVALFVLPRSSFTTKRGWELCAQVVVTVLVVSAVFYPGQFLPFAFLPFVPLTWGSLRFGTGIMALEALGITILVTVLTELGGGPFAVIVRQDAQLGLHSLQMFMAVVAATVLVLGKSRVERERLVSQVRAREQVLRGGIIGSTLGFIILENDGGRRLRISAFSESARSLLALGPTWRSGELFDGRDLPRDFVQQIESAISEPGFVWSGSLTMSRELVVEAYVSRVDDVGGNFVVTIQVEDVSARVRSERATANALANEQATVERLHEASRQQEDFVSAVSHELRNPLTSIKGFTDELLDSDLKEPAPHYLEIIKRNADRLSTLVEDLLEAARISSGADRGTPEPCDVRVLAVETTEDLRHLAVSKSVELTVADGGGETTVMGVRNDLGRIFTNLVSNALKFTPEGGRVEISFDVVDKRCVVRITDSGTGIPPEELERVFQKFYRTPGAKSVQGTGLGLAITRALAEAAGGTVHLESDGSTGTTAVVVLPLALNPGNEN
jgi:two-component system, OmpR family, phosphate regulon sensor histidine kinase PhoR